MPFPPPPPHRSNQPNLTLTARRVVRGDVTGGLTTHAERQAFAETTADTRAHLTVKLAEEQQRQRMPAWAIRKIEADARAYADGLGRIAEQRERDERGDAQTFSLDQIAEETAEHLK